MSSRHPNRKVKKHSKKGGLRSDAMDPTVKQVSIQRPVPKTAVSIQYSIWETQFAQIAGAAQFGSAGFVLSQFPIYLQYTGTYDLYKIDFMEITFLPMANAQGLTAPSTTIAPELFTAVDYDSSTAPTLLDSIRSYGRYCQIDSPFVKVVRRWVPRCKIGVWNGSAVASAGVMEKMWIDCAVTNIPFYGLVFGCDAGAAGQTLLQEWRVNLVVGMTFKYQQ